MRSPGGPSGIEVHEVFGRERARQAVEAALADYRERFLISR